MWAHRKTRARARCRAPNGARVGALALIVAAAAFAAMLGTAAVGVTEDEMYTLWGKAALRFEETHTVLPAGSAESVWVQTVGNHIVESWPDRRWVVHSFVVVRDPDPGAWSFPTSRVDHKVYVTTGLLEFVREAGAKDAEHRLAGVLGHEVAHLMRDHHLLRQRRSEMLNLEVPQDLAQWPAAVLGRWQEEDEFEADRYGALYGLHAGYSFDGITGFLAAFLRRYGDAQALDDVGAATGRAHPSLMRRIATLQRERDKIEEARRLFELGLDMLRARAWGPARACFAKVRDSFPLSPTVVHDLAYAELMDYESALPDGPPLEQCVSTPYLTELVVKGGMSDPDPTLLVDAKAHFLKACEFDQIGGFIAPRIGIARAYLDEGDDVEARACLEGVQLGLDDPGYLNLVGVLAERAGDLAAARRAYSKALNLRADSEAEEAAAEASRSPQPYVPALYNLARLLEREHRYEAGRLYTTYLAVDRGHSRFGALAEEGALRCGGQIPYTDEPQAVDGYRGIEVRSSGRLVVLAALGQPERVTSLTASGQTVTLYEYPTQGVSVALAPGPAGDAVVTYIALTAPNRDPVAGARLGDLAATVREHLGSPLTVVEGDADSAWWDYPSAGIALYMKDGRVQRCLIGGPS